MFELLQGCNSQERLARDRNSRHVTGSDPEVTSLERNSPGSGCRRSISQVLSTMFELAGGGRHVTGNDVK